MDGKSDGSGKILRSDNLQHHMARGIESFKELNARQTREFLANLSNPRNLRRSQAAIERVRKIRFNVIE
jgi:hypothetical protein